MEKICHLSSVHSLTDTRIFHKECKTLVYAGYNVKFVVQHESDEELLGVEIRGIEKPRNRQERMIKTVGQVYRRALECDADVYHFHDPELIPVGLRLKRNGKKVVYDVHEDVPRQILSKHWLPYFSREMISWNVERMENFAAKRFDHIITATPFIRERFRRINHKTIDVNNFPLLSELHVPSVNWDRKEKVVCYVGGIGKARGIFEMVEAIGLTKYSMLLAGRFGSPAGRESAVSMDGWGNVQELGHINRADVKKVLSRSMAGLVVLNPIPNYVDALPVKMFEYMSAGIPVIASNFPLWKEIVEGNSCGICVDPLNVKEIASAIIWIIEHPEQAKAMGENGRKAVEGQYNWEKEGEKLISIYRELLE